MSVIRHSDPDAFLAAAEPALTRRETAAAFAAWVGSLKTNPARNGEVYLATYIGPDGRGAAIRRSDGPLVFEDADPAAAVAFARDLVGECPRLSGVVGKLAACEAFVRMWSVETGRAHELRVHLRYFMLTHVAPVPPVAGAPRLAGKQDGAWLIEAQHMFMVEAGVPESPERVVAAIPHRIEDGRYWIWDDRGAQAYAGWTPAGVEAARIAPVFTLPLSRRRGYATALVAALSHSLLAQGRQRMFLMTDVANPTSNAIYQRIGFRPQSDIYHFDFVD